ncbi:hypothetical protein ACOZ4B_04945 [Haloferax prahovense]|uniref:hypothetical protein n=1 Tax=Haloferax prahovense TaxID=381852 RepID=UPI003C70BDD9
MRGALSETTKRVDRWLDQVFFAAWEVSVLAIPTLWFLLFATPRAEVSLSGLTALAASAVAVGSFRGGYVGTGSWPRPGHLPTLPIRSAYYSLVVGGTALLGAFAQTELGAFWPGIVVPAVVGVGALALVPVVLVGTERVARVTL